MAYPSTAKQRLWLTSLGFDVARECSGDDARSHFDEADRSGQYDAALTREQRQLAALDELKKSLLHRAFSGEL